MNHLCMYSKIGGMLVYVINDNAYLYDSFIHSFSFGSIKSLQITPNTIITLFINQQHSQIDSMVQKKPFTPRLSNPKSDNTCIYVIGFSSESSVYHCF